MNDFFLNFVFFVLLFVFLRLFGFFVFLFAAEYWFVLLFQLALVLFVHFATARFEFEGWNQPGKIATKKVTPQYRYADKIYLMSFSPSL